MTPQELPAPYAGPSLRIAYVGNFRHPWCTEVHIAGSLESLGHTVHRMQEDIMDWGKLPAQCQALGAQAVFWTRTWPAEMSVVEPVLKELAAEGIPTVSYHLDRWHGLNREHQVRDQPFFRTSLVVSPNDDPRWAEDGVNHFWLPPGVYGPECEPVPPNPRRWPFDVVFVGSHPYPHPEWAKYRGDLLATFQRAFRGRFGILPRRGVPVRGRDLQEVYATVPVVLGDSCLAGESYRYWSDRVPETLGRGGLLVHPEVDGMWDWYVAGKDFAGYKLGRFDDAVSIARSALDDPGAVAEHGRATVLSRDTYAHRMATVLAVAEGIYGGYRDVQPVVPPGMGWSKRMGSSDLELVNIPGYPVAPRLAVSDIRITPDRSKWPEPMMVAVSPLRPSRGLPVAPPATTQRRVRLGRMSARFDLRTDVPTDGEVLDEVWVRNDYRVDRRFSGTVVDIGANIGAFSVLAAKAGARLVVAYEPEEGNFERLHHHLDLNRCEAVTMQEAVTRAGVDQVAITGKGGGARLATTSDVDPEGVPCTTLAGLLDQWGPVEFLKMDIEGGEYPAFESCPVEALAGIERMALEFHGPLMPHLAHLDDGYHLERWGAMVAKLADAGRVEIFGHPMRGGLIWWQRF